MEKSCIDCGKSLSFLDSVLNTRCPECREIIAVEQNRVNNNKVGNIEKIQPHNEKNDTTNELIGGRIEFYNLQDWWLNELSNEERNSIISNYHPLGLNPDFLTHGKISSSNQSAIAFLTNLSGGSAKLRYKILNKAESLVSEKTRVLDKHFLYQVKIETYYRHRDIDEFALLSAIEACKQQISISTNAKRVFLKELNGQLPSHVGYNQLCIIMEKQQKFDEAIRLAKEAKEEGWTGEWDKRIERCIKKIKCDFKK